MLHLLFLPHLAPQPFLLTPHFFSPSLATRVPQAIPEKELSKTHSHQVRVVKLEEALYLNKPRSYFPCEDLKAHGG